MAQDERSNIKGNKITTSQPQFKESNGHTATSNQQQNAAAADDFVDSLTAAMPPSLQEKRETSVDQLLADLNRVPLFMTELDESEENPMLDAIKALVYEGTRAEVAANFREQGNDAVKQKLWKDAREFYTKAIQTLKGQIKTTDVPEEERVKVVEIDDEEEERKEKELLEICLVNRAHCNLQLKNYASVSRDCASTLHLNPRNLKAWYRAASACYSLDKLPEALDACTTALQFDATNPSLQALQTQIKTRQAYLAAQEAARKEREEKAKRVETTLKEALRRRGWVLREGEGKPEMEDAVISLSDPEDESSVLAVPVLFLYPLHAQTDLIKAFQETETLNDHLKYILPLPWDSDHEYTASTGKNDGDADTDAIECYMETNQGGLIKAGKKLPLSRLLSSGKVEIVDGLVRVYVVPKKRAQEWIEQFKARRGKQ